MHHLSAGIQTVFINQKMCEAYALQILLECGWWIISRDLVHFAQRQQSVSQSVSHVHARRRECVAVVDARQWSRPFLILLRLKAASEHMTAVTVFYNSSHEDGVLLHCPDCALTPITRNEHILQRLHYSRWHKDKGQTTPSAFSQRSNVLRTPKTSRWHLTHSIGYVTRDL